MSLFHMYQVWNPRGQKPYILNYKKCAMRNNSPIQESPQPPSSLGPCSSTNPRKDQDNPTQPIKEGGSKTKEKRKEQGKVNQLLDLLQANQKNQPIDRSQIGQTDQKTNVRELMAREQDKCSIKAAGILGLGQGSKIKR